MLSKLEVELAFAQAVDSLIATSGVVYAAVVMLSQNEWVIEIGVENIDAYREVVPSSLPLSTSGGLDFEEDRVPVILKEVEPFKLLYSGRKRPAMGADSIGIVSGTNSASGTLGYVTKIDAKPGELYLVTNWHVLFAGKVGDPVIQPGPHDGGVPPGDVIATLSWGKFDGIVDIALAKVNNPADVAEMRVRQANNTSAPIKGVASAVINNRVWFNGWQTNWTGIVRSTTATVNIIAPDGTTKSFSQQILIENPNIGPALGDSGSAVTDVNNKIVGLLFAKSGNFGLANSIENVIKAIKEFSGAALS